MPAPDSFRDTMLQLEQQLLDPRVRRDRTRLETLLTEDFVEFGSSGRVFDRETVIAELARETLSPERHIADFGIVAATQDLAVVTYRIITLVRTEKQPVTSLRSSTWILRDGQWQMRFHQGTRSSAPDSPKP